MDSHVKSQTLVTVKEKKIRKRLVLDKVNSHIEPLLKVTNLTADFNINGQKLRILDGISFSLYPSEILALVGETGCGKSVCAKSIMHLIPEKNSTRGGTIAFNGQDLLGLSNKEMRNLRGRKIGMIFQNPIGSINPVFTLGEQISRLIKLYLPQKINSVKKSLGYNTKSAVKHIATESLKEVGLTDIDQFLTTYAHQISGGMAQRFRIATALLGNPELLIADEATSALDVTVQAHILGLMKKICDVKKTTILFITHDLGIAAQLCDRVAVMYSGRIVEVANTTDLFERPLHPYTQGLLKAVPRLGKKKELEQIPGTIPNLKRPPQGCRFHPRCKWVMDICSTVRPPVVEQEGREVCCHLYSDSTMLSSQQSYVVC